MRLHRTRRPTRSDSSHPSAAVRESACRADFSSMPNIASTVTSVDVQTGTSRGSTYSPSTVIKTDRALAWLTSRRLDTLGCATSVICFTSLAEGHHSDTTAVTRTRTV